MLYHVVLHGRREAFCVRYVLSTPRIPVSMSYFFLAGIREAPAHGFVRRWISPGPRSIINSYYY